MKHYVIADIHGCYEEYKMLLSKLSLIAEDEVYILGDSVDRGPEPIRVLRDIANRPNMHYILGNHDIMMLTALRPLMQEITEKSINTLEMNGDIYLAFGDWINNGGSTTLEQFMALDRWEQEDILSFLEECPSFETIERDDKLYILVHAGINNFSVDKELEEYSTGDFIWGRADYQKPYYPGGRIFLVTGHTPVQYIREDKQPIVYAEHNHITIDCGCVFGGRLLHIVWRVTRRYMLMQ